MTDKEAFHFGFLLRCAEEGLTPEETDARMEKVALTPLDTLLSLGASGVDAAKGVLGAAGRMSLFGLPLVAGGAYGAGHLAGGLAAGALDPGYTPEEINRRELIATYNDLASALENRARRRLQGPAR